ncbi:MAG: GNAT family N-acetyltransferase [Bacteroidota bacterium]
MPIRTLEPRDRPELLRMRRALWPDCSDDMHEFELLQGQLAKPDSYTIFVYPRDNGKLGGFIEMSVRSRVDGSFSERVGYIEGWYVDPDLRGSSIGRQLVEAGEQWTRERGLTEIASDAELENASSISAHKALGFRETFRLVHFLKPLRE